MYGLPSGRKFGKNGLMEAIQRVGVRDIAVRLAALRMLLAIATEPVAAPEPLPCDPQEAATFQQLVMDGQNERAIASALGWSLDEVRAMLVRLAR